MCATSFTKQVDLELMEVFSVLQFRQVDNARKVAAIDNVFRDAIDMDKHGAA